MTHEMDLQDKNKLKGFSNKCNRFSQLKTTLKIIEENPGIMEHMIRNKHPDIFTNPTIRKHVKELRDTYENRDRLRNEFGVFMNELDNKGINVGLSSIENVLDLFYGLELVKRFQHDSEPLVEEWEKKGIDKDKVPIERVQDLFRFEEEGSILDMNKLRDMFGTLIEEWKSSEIDVGRPSIERVLNLFLESEGIGPIFEKHEKVMNERIEKGEI
jgi:hypothetical protein